MPEAIDGKTINNCLNCRSDCLCLWILNFIKTNLCTLQVCRLIVWIWHITTLCQSINWSLNPPQGRQSFRIQRINIRGYVRL